MFFRYKVLTHKGVQFRIGAIALFWFLIFSLSLLGLFFLNYEVNSTRVAGMSSHDELITKTLLVEQGQSLATWFAMVWIGFGILIWLYITVYTHRLTGPVYKLERLLEKCVHNRSLPDHALRFRKTDAFPELAELFNQFVEISRERSEKGHISEELKQSPKE